MLSPGASREATAIAESGPSRSQDAVDVAASDATAKVWCARVRASPCMREPVRAREPVHAREPVRVRAQVFVSLCLFFAICVCVCVTRRGGGAGYVWL